MGELVLKGIAKSYQSFTLKIDFLKIPEGKILCIKGPNGSGKSTLLNIVAGLVRPDSGSILHKGEDITYLEPDERRFPIIRSERGIFPHMSVEKNIKIVKRIDDTGLEKILDLLGIGYDMMRKKAGELSTGWKIRVLIARALASKPEVLLIDEGLDHLDPMYIECCIEDLMNYVREKKITTLIVTHKNEIECDEKIEIRNGSIYNEL